MLMYLGYTAPIGEMHPAQIATQLGCSIDTVQRLINSAVKKLKKDVNLKLLAA
ncbi:MAG: sigma-70 family RNA polymerase sigma factor [Bacteroidaceae bacterium]|nr:sigma-70 family RNA polymerase sigma factor [Bacteroidaceae bacterium]